MLRIWLGFFLISSASFGAISQDAIFFWNLGEEAKDRKLVEQDQLDNNLRDIEKSRILLEKYLGARGSISERLLKEAKVNFELARVAAEITKSRIQEIDQEILVAKARQQNKLEKNNFLSLWKTRTQTAELRVKAGNIRLDYQNEFLATMQNLGDSGSIALRKLLDAEFEQKAALSDRDIAMERLVHSREAATEVETLK